MSSILLRNYTAAQGKETVYCYNNVLQNKEKIHYTVTSIRCRLKKRDGILLQQYTAGQGNGKQYVPILLSNTLQAEEK